MFLEKPRNSSDVGGRVKQSQQAISDDSITNIVELFVLTAFKGLFYI